MHKCKKNSLNEIILQGKKEGGFVRFCDSLDIKVDVKLDVRCKGRTLIFSPPKVSFTIGEIKNCSLF